MKTPKYYLTLNKHNTPSKQEDPSSKARVFFCLRIDVC